MPRQSKDVVKYIESRSIEAGRLLVTVRTSKWKEKINAGEYEAVTWYSKVVGYEAKTRDDCSSEYACLYVLDQQPISRPSIFSSVFLLPRQHPFHPLHHHHLHRPSQHRCHFRYRCFRVQSHILQRRQSRSPLGSLHRRTLRLRQLNRGQDGHRHRWISRRSQGLL